MPDWIIRGLIVGLCIAAIVALIRSNGPRRGR